jgi:glycosyltransferase involved in cell wall biosynthesis
VRLLIGIPIYNERKSVDRVLGQVLAHGHDVLLVDDASTDGTADYLAGRSDVALIRHGSNQGYGQGIIDIFDYADRCGYDWVITMDCDEQHEPARIPDFVAAIETNRWDLVSGSRYLQPDDADDAPPADRRSVNATITTLVNDTFGWHLTDTFCGFKAHRVESMRQLRLTETGYAFPLQLWPRVFKADLRVTEIPVRRIYHDMSRTFGPALNDPGKRLRHYLDVFETELTRPWPVDDAVGVAADARLCCC